MTDQNQTISAARLNAIMKAYQDQRDAAQNAHASIAGELAEMQERLAAALAEIETLKQAAGQEPPTATSPVE